MEILSGSENLAVTVLSRLMDCGVAVIHREIRYNRRNQKTSLLPPYLALRASRMTPSLRRISVLSMQITAEELVGGRGTVADRTKLHHLAVMTTCPRARMAAAAGARELVDGVRAEFSGAAVAGVSRHGGDVLEVCADALHADGRPGVLVRCADALLFARHARRGDGSQPGRSPKLTHDPSTGTRNVCHSGLNSGASKSSRVGTSGQGAGGNSSGAGTSTAG